jgi:hypothetical protein
MHERGITHLHDRSGDRETECTAKVTHKANKVRICNGMRYKINILANGCDHRHISSLDASLDGDKGWL